MESVTLGDVTLAYEVSGPDAGEPVVLICGCGGPAAGWFALTPALVDAGYRVVTFDNRGVAPSSSPPAPYTIDAMVGDEPWTNPGRLGQYEACLGWYERDAEHAAARTTITVPCLVMAFEHDIDSPPRYAREAAAEIPNGKYAEVADASHLAPYTHADDVARLVLDFLVSL